MNNNVVSMTGFGRARAVFGTRTVGVEIRSLNHRGLDLKVRAYDLQLAPEIEAEVTRLIRQRLTRGSVVLSLRDEGAGGHANGIDVERIRQAYGALEGLRQQLGLSAPVELGAVGSLLAAMKGASSTEIPASAWPDLQPAVESALAGLCAMRVQEGASMLADLRQRLATLRGLVDRIAGLATGVPARVARRLEDRLTALTSSTVPIDPGRLAQEAAILAERFDVSEEIVRLRAHFDHLTTLFDGRSKDSPGRRIDFLAQEIARELNTLGGKIQDATISALVIDGKAELEKLREQAQNIE